MQVHLISPGQTGIHLSAAPNIPVRTDDAQDPVNLIFTGYAPSAWVVSNIAGWSDSAYCSNSKTVNGREYNYTLEKPDSTGIPCFGPRDHVRVWDMGYSPVFGFWSVGSAHHENTVCNPACHHVIDSWDRAEDDLVSSFLGRQSTISLTNYTLRNSGSFQGVFDDGNATMIELKPPVSDYPVVFNEGGLSNQTSWSLTVNGTTTSSQRPAIVVDEPNGSYVFTIAKIPGFIAYPSSGSFKINGRGVTENIEFKTPWTTISLNLNSGGQQVSIGFNGNATIASSTVQLSTSSNTDLRFSATEKGRSGILNITVPKSVVPSNALAEVSIDGQRDDTLKVVTDASNYYSSFTVPYGTHSVDLQFTPTNSYVPYIITGGIAGGILTALFVTLILKKRKTRIVPGSP